MQYREDIQKMSASKPPVENYAESPIIELSVSIKRFAQGLACQPDESFIQGVQGTYYPIFLDGESLPTYNSALLPEDNCDGINQPGLNVRAFADWVATSGTHTFSTVNAYDNHFSCTFVVP